MTNPNEPTLTCSEVVERLLNEAYQPNGNYHESEFDTEIAEKILTEWRERRVQELEKCLREIALALKVGQGVGVAESCRLYAENTLAKSADWREHIRKGAKHD